MLSENDIRLAVEDAVRAYTVKHPGERGWEREDIEKAIRQMGGDEKDVCEAVFQALKKFLGDEIERISPRPKLN